MRLKYFFILIIITGFVMSTAAPVMSKRRTTVRGKIIKIKVRHLVIYDKKSDKKIIINITPDTEFTGTYVVEPKNIKDRTYGTVKISKRKGPKLLKGKTDVVYTAKEILLNPDDEKQKANIKSKSIKGFISVKGNKIKVEADGEVYTFKTDKKFEGVFEEEIDITKKDLKKDLNVEVTGIIFSNSINAESIEIFLKHKGKNNNK